MKPILIIVMVVLSHIVAAQKAMRQGPATVKPVIEDHLKLSLSASIHGFIGDRLDASYQNRILAQDVDRLVEPFRNRTETSCWQSEFWGKWITSAILAYRYQPTPKLKEALDHAVTGLIATQGADGYIGNYSDGRRLESWDIWGRKYCMLGLLDYYEITGDGKVLFAARKVADHLIKELSDKNVLIVKKGNHRGMAATSVLEPVCKLYAATGDKQYLDFANEIVRQWETADGPQLITKSGIAVSQRFPKPESWYGPEQGQKAYEMMSCYEGLLELYRLTGNQVYKSAVEKTWKSILDTEINVAGSGSAVECWFGGRQLQAFPVFHYQETCVTVTWIKLCQQMLRLTGEAKYADAIEQAYYNALLGAMTTDGSDWAKYTPLNGQRMPGSEQCGMGLNCCTASGPRGLFNFPLTAVMSSGTGVQVNFFIQGQSELLTPGKNKITLLQTTDYPATGKISIRVQLPKPEHMTIGVRIPIWSAKTVASVNGEKFNAITPGQVFNISRNWQNGDEISLELDMRGRIESLGELPQNIALFYGPLVLSRDARLAGPPLNAVIKPVIGKDGFVDLKPTEIKNPGIWVQVEALVTTESYSEGGSQPIQSMFCDYASAGNTIDEKSVFRTWFPQLINPRELTD